MYPCTQEKVEIVTQGKMGGTQIIFYVDDVCAWMDCLRMRYGVLKKHVRTTCVFSVCQAVVDV